MFIPKKSKLNKNFFTEGKGYNFKSSTLIYGDFGIKIVESGLITPGQMEAIRKIIKKKTKQYEANLWFRVFPHFSITKKPVEVRMGKGKGNISDWYSYLRPGQMLLEVKGFPSNEAFKLLKKCLFKLSFKCKIINSYS